MQFRYKIAKKTFKNKKIPPKKESYDEFIPPDQRGNHSSADVSPLSLDRETSTREPPKAEPVEMSRRGFFSFGKLEEFADKIGEEEAKIKKKKSSEKEDQEIASGDDPAVGEPDAEESEPTVEILDPAPVEKKGVFKRLVDRFRPGSEPEPETSKNVPKDEQEPPPKVPVAEEPETVEVVAEEEEPNPEDDPEYDRRNLLRQGIHFFAKPAVDSVQKKIDKVNDAVDKITKRVPLIRPPGAVSEQKFLQACTRCDECVNACPKDAIVKAPKKMGFLIMGTPYIDAIKNPCVVCDDLPCISACKDSALLPVPSKFDVKMGYAILDKNKCQAYGHTFCQQCVIDCPIPGAITPVDDKPMINKKDCTGCGVCMRSCSTVNIPVAIKIKPQMVIEYQIQKKKMEREKELREAELLAARQKELEEENVEAN